MKNTFILLLLIIASACQTNYYVVRHAEKAAEPRQDPPLTAEGQQRAERLKDLLKNKGIKEIYSSNYVRTQETARPTAEMLNLAVASYNPGKQDIFIEQLKSAKKNTLIVGHSNTVRYVINGLTEEETLKQDLQDDEYSNLFIIKRKRFPKKQVFERVEF